MPLSIDGLAIAKAGIAVYVVIMFCLAYMGVGFARSLKEGKNGITLGLMCLFFALANEHFYLAVSASVQLYSDLYEEYALVIWLWRILSLSLILAAFIVLFIEFWVARQHDKKPV